MNVPFLNLAAQHASLKGELLPVVEQALAGGHYILGPNVAALEQEIAAFTRTRFGIGVNSGSDALTLALKALEIIYYPQPLHLQKVYSDLGYREGDFPVAEVSKRILPLPMYPELTDAQVDYVIATVRKFSV